MTVDDLVAMLSEGMDDATTAAIRKAADRDVIKTKAATIKQQNEYQAIVDQQNKLQAELDGDKTQGIYGARAYQQWYLDNSKAIETLKTKAAAYETKYGSLENPTTQANPNPQTVPMTKDDIQRLVDEKIQTSYAPQWSNLLTSTGTIVQKHMFAGRKTPIDFDALSKLAPKYNNDLTAAYDEWDKPEREKVDAKTREDEITRRVNEELQKRGAASRFPAGADFSTPSSLSMRTKDSTDKFDKTSMQNELANLFMSGGESN